MSSAAAQSAGVARDVNCLTDTDRHARKRAVRLSSPYVRVCTCVSCVCCEDNVLV